MENNTPQMSPGNSLRSSWETRGIDLDITGSGLMLSGRFSDWESGVLMGPDLDQLQVRLSIDATSASVGSTDSVGAPLFSFRGRDAASVAPGLYQIDGDFTGPSGTRPLQMHVETPIQHSAIFLLSFQARKSDFGPAWTRLLSNVVPFGTHADGPSMPAHAWLTVPHLAAA
jgi:polyisoprenoid-binding protein YceI